LVRRTGTLKYLIHSAKKRAGWLLRVLEVPLASLEVKVDVSGEIWHLGPGSPI
jgi:hypothetical protein